MSIQVVSHEVVDSDEFLEKPRTLEVCVIRGWLKRPPSGRRTAGKVNVGCASSALNGGKAEDDSQPQRTLVARLGAMAVLMTAASLVAGSMVVGHQEVAAAAPDRHDVEISSPTSDAPVEAGGGESFDVGFATDVPWRYALEVRGTTADGEWTLHEGDDR